MTCKCLVWQYHGDGYHTCMACGRDEGSVPSGGVMMGHTCTICIKNALAMSDEDVAALPDLQRCHVEELRVEVHTCRLCDDTGLPILLEDGSLIYECEGDREQTEGLAKIIADGCTDQSEEIWQSVYVSALRAIRKANR